MFIYKLTFSNNKSYIGLVWKIGKTLYQRFHQHVLGAQSKSCKHGPLHNAIKKYGKQNIKYEILEDGITDYKYLCERQNFNILKYDTYVSKFRPGNGYNCDLGGRGNPGYRHTEQDIQIIRRKRTGKRDSQESKKRKSIAQTGRKLTEQDKKKISIKRKKYLQEHPEIRIILSQRGKLYKRTQQTIQKIKISKQGWGPTEEHLQKLLEGSKAYYANEQNLKIVSQRSKRMWENRSQQYMKRFGEQMKQRHKDGKRGMKGKKHKQQSKQKNSISLHGKKKSKQHCQNISKGKIGIKLSQQHVQGLKRGWQKRRLKPVNPQIGKKIRDKLKGRKRPEQVMLNIRFTKYIKGIKKKCQYLQRSYDKVINWLQNTGVDNKIQETTIN